MKKVGILGTGSVGKTVGNKLIALGFEVKMGSRTADNPKATEWAQSHPERATHGTFADAARFADILFNCTKGEITLEALALTGAEHCAGKIIIDLSNPLDFSKGMPPSLFAHWSNTNSLGEEVQKALPEARVVKTLNIVNCEVMVNPARSGGEPTMFLCGNDAGAKAEVTALLQSFGWRDLIDLGDISGARGMEMMLPVWVRTWGATGNGHFAFKIVR